ncbi:c-type cytochrome [Pacificimonas sp. WHA3]|uniref:C-type cytochrome n=1 Tax=Pacificimonas pallii TaxID=2827236 RepID=A0ABS6SGL4_9SPHN|nr:cytochrome c [Pacificimonas pallii]MBV7257530.1 c-type cytochrome [Pacificimonas pallii]
MKQSIAFVALTALWSLSACAPQAPVNTGQDQLMAVSRGGAIANTVCAECHAIEAAESPHPNAPPFQVIAERYPPEALAEAFAEGIDVGHPDMPNFMFEPGENADLIAFLQSLRKTEPRQ